MKTELTYLETRIGTLVARLRELQSDNAALQQALVQTKDEHVHLHEQHAQFQDLLAQKDAQYQQLKQQNDYLQGLIAQSIHDIQALMKHLPAPVIETEPKEASHE
ncbi:hypothetical protein [Neisseria sp. Ec49-e6-T10]|uniref:hypothetical protein n=1 Tax=Neisseria sp. Ec49-e6-T10 TaxID=3140744 RepID=UPI003EB7C981